MKAFKPTIKYEIVIGLDCEPDNNSNRRFTISAEYVRYAWQKYAKDFYEENNVYVSSISLFGYALYHTDWGCPYEGEQCLSFHCTANPEFVKDMDMYEKGLLYIVKKLKKEFDQHTITITKIPSEVLYLTDEDNEE